MTTAEAVKAAKSPQEAMLVIADTLDAIVFALDKLHAQPPNDGWGEWAPVPTEDHPTPKDEPAVKIAVGDDGGTVTEFPVSDDPDVHGKRLDWWFAYMGEAGYHDEVRDAFVTCGPAYLYSHSRKALVDMPRGAKLTLIQDMIDDGRFTEADDMAKDLLMDRGPGTGVPERWAGAEAA